MDPCPASSSDSTTPATDEEDYFVAYACKASKMKGWQLTNELATQVANFDNLESENLYDQIPPDNASKVSRTTRHIEILMKENSKRKKY